MIRPGSILLLLVGAGSLVACNDPNTVLFVTNSSLGINFDSKPPTANIAYDRTEGYIAPRYPNGGAPPVAASMETGGNIFNPIVRQSYVTGSAAVIATGGTPQNPPTEMTGERDKKKLMFVGTATTVGLKVGFSGETGAAPDSLLFGYRRKEISVIPLGEENLPDGKVRAVYPSVFASVDMNTTTSDPGKTGITSKQFFATGQAADQLVKNNPAVSAAFGVKAQDAAMVGLTPDQRLEAEQKASKFLKAHADQQDAVVAYLTKDGPFTTEKLNALIKKVNDGGGAVPGWVGRVKSADELKQGLRRAPIAAEILYKATQS